MNVHVFDGCHVLGQVKKMACRFASCLLTKLSDCSGTKEGAGKCVEDCVPRVRSRSIFPPAFLSSRRSILCPLLHSPPSPLLISYYPPPFSFLLMHVSYSSWHIMPSILCFESFCFLLLSPLACSPIPPIIAFVFLFFLRSSGKELQWISQWGTRLVFSDSIFCCGM